MWVTFINKKGRLLRDGKTALGAVRKAIEMIEFLSNNPMQLIHLYSAGLKIKGVRIWQVF
jgi:hypothetical protein